MEPCQEPHPEGKLAAPKILEQEAGGGRRAEMRGPRSMALEAKTQLAIAESQTPELPTFLLTCPTYRLTPSHLILPSLPGMVYLQPPNAQTLSSFPSQPVLQALPTSLPTHKDHEEGLLPLGIQGTVYKLSYNLPIFMSSLLRLRLLKTGGS